MKELSAYAASKGAITQLTKVIAVEYGGQGIRANAVGPGVVETDILQGTGVQDSRATLSGYGGVHPVGRVAQPPEIAEVIAFLASPASSFMTGALVMVDGGYTALQGGPAYDKGHLDRCRRTRPGPGSRPPVL